MKMLLYRILQQRIHAHCSERFARKHEHHKRFTSKDVGKDSWGTVSGLMAQR
jgi:hypothetical protein